MNLKLIACSIFQRELCAALASTPNVVDVEFVEIAEHSEPVPLRKMLQARIDTPRKDLHKGHGAGHYDAILLAYGICGNAATGLCARDIPLVLPRAHDCATILLGSRDAFQTHFGANPSHPFGCVGYFERGFNNCVGDPVDDGRPIADPEFLKYIDDYGEENARFIWETLHPRVPSDGRALFITTPPTRGHPAQDAFRRMVEADGLVFEEVPGQTSLLDRLINGPWDPADFLVVPPRHCVRGVYDHTQVMDAVPSEQPQENKPCNP